MRSLNACANIPEVLIVLNHPFWLEEGVEETDHRGALDRYCGSRRLVSRVRTERYAAVE